MQSGTAAGFPTTEQVRNYSPELPDLLIVYLRNYTKGAKDCAPIVIVFNCVAVICFIYKMFCLFIVS